MAPDSPATPEQIRRAARQNLSTMSLLGVEFFPVMMRIGPDQVPPADTEAPAHEPIETIEEPASRVQESEGAEPLSPISPSAGTSPWSAAAAMTTEEKIAALRALRQRHDQSCPHCTTVASHTQTVFGEGNPNAAIMFIGEAPGEEEDRTGRPFVGRAGQKLDEIIKAMGLQRGDVYIANVLKSRPPENRTPLQHEVDRCGPFLDEQIRIIQPKVIVALGGPAAKLLLKTDIGITRLRGSWSEYRNRDLTVPVMPTFHPAYLLRNYTRETREKVWSDMKQVLARLNDS